ncbi:Uncharacterized protein dnm_082930 [Desulfonema magnum]|uniref:Uncharacterized protein n=1 Tax=Desulfonema magnum TaxID=45655 RepID=A0A975GSS4_9BACT|nr:Uncharacterized protein dnm_082930 [Desulfonema magnum]
MLSGKMPFPKQHSHNVFFQFGICLPNAAMGASAKNDFRTLLNQAFFLYRKL